MSDLLWPGDHRAGELFSDAAVLAALVAVEQAWLDALGGSGTRLPVPGELDVLAADAGGNPVIPLVTWLREQTGEKLLHRGLTSQDVLDTALVLCARDALGAIDAELRRQAAVLVDLAVAHRDTVTVARTLTRPAVPTTFGLKAAGWLSGVLDALDDVARLRYPVQLGGAGGTLAGGLEVAGDRLPEVTARFAASLGLSEALPWHTGRAPVTRIGDAAVRCTDAWGRIARDVLLLTRPEFGELSLGSSGGSSTMPHKQNPTLAVLVRRAALAAPGLGSTLHLAAADATEERSDGAWHVEWDTLATLLRRTVVAGSHLSELVEGLQVHPDRMAVAVETYRNDLLAEQHSLAAFSDRAEAESPAEYLGEATRLVDRVVARARTALA